MEVGDGAKRGKRLPGLSRNQLCVATMTDGKVCVLVPCGVGHPSARQVLKAYGPHIERGSRIVHDGDASHDALIGELGLESEVHPTADTKAAQGRTPVHWELRDQGEGPQIRRQGGGEAGLQLSLQGGRGAPD